MTFGDRVETTVRWLIVLTTVWAVVVAPVSVFVIDPLCGEAAPTLALFLGIVAGAIATLVFYEWIFE